MRKPSVPRIPRTPAQPPTYRGSVGAGRADAHDAPRQADHPDAAAQGEAGAEHAQSNQPAPSASRSLTTPGLAHGAALFSRRAARSVAGLGEAVVSTGLTERLAERRRVRRKLRRRRVGEIALAVLAVLALAWALLFSPLMALRSNQITVTGSDGSVSAGQVRSALKSYTGTSLLRLDVGSMGRDVEKALVHVRTAQVTRSWFHGVEVSLTMRVPVAVYQNGDAFDVLDGDAVVVETVAQAPQGLAVITPESASAGLTADQVTAVATVMGALDNSARAQVASGSASTSGLVTLVLTNGSTVRWGDTKDVALKAQVLKVLLGTSASVYDVTSPRSPTTS